MTPDRPRAPNNFNLIRLLLATMVIVGHSPELIDGDRRREPLSHLLGTDLTLGTLAVDGFFLLSGFLIVQSWSADPRLLAFLRKRVLRIYPGFVAAALITALVVGPLGGNPYYWRDFRAMPFLFTVATLNAPNVPRTFEDLPYHELNGSLWTIRYEFACYLAVAAMGLAGAFRSRAAVLGLFLVATSIHLAQVATADFGLREPGRMVGLLLPLPRLFSYFLAGACFSVFAGRLRFPAVATWPAAAILLASAPHFPASQATLPVLGGYLLLAFAFARIGPLAGYGRLPDVSYGVYLYAWPIQMLLIEYVRPIGPGPLFVASFALSGLMGLLSCLLVERPFLRWKGPGRSVPGAPRPAPAIPSAVDQPQPS